MSPWVIVLILLSSLIFIVVYGQVVKSRGGDDILQDHFAPCKGCDYWALLHTVLFFILAYLFPQYILEFSIIGIMWELLEYSTGDPEVREIIGLDFRGGKWWYGRLSDIMFNSIGLILGYLASRG